MNGMCSRALLVTASSAVLIAATTASAQTASPQAATVAEVIVTGTKTGAQKLQKTPDAITVVTGAQLEDKNIGNLRDLAQYIPNFSFNQNTASAELYIRGVGSNNVGVGSDPDVTTQIDGVYIARPSGQFADFLDVQNVEVLRGPQGTLYGRNAVGGTINIISRAPSDTFSGEAQVSAGNYNLTQEGLYVTGPLVKGVLDASIAVDYANHDGYFKNIAPGGHDVGTANHGGAKVQLLWKPNADVSATTRIDLSGTPSKEYFDTYSHLIVPTPFPTLANKTVGNLDEVALNTPQQILTQNDGVSEDVVWNISDEFSLKSISAFRTSKFKYTNDNDATELNLSSQASSETDEQYSQEFDLQYHHANLSGVVGLYYFYDTDRANFTVTVPPSVITPAAHALFNEAKPVVDSGSGAIFGQGTYNLTSAFSITLGARYTAERKSFDQTYLRLSENPATLGKSFPGFPIRLDAAKDYNAFTPKLSVNWQITKDALFYVSATRGFKSGGFNYTATTLSAAEFSPEKIWSYEAGAKTEWFDHRLRANLTGFYYDYTDLQVQQYISNGVVSIGNAATATVKGVELEAVAKPIRPLQLTANISVLDAQYQSYDHASVPTGLIHYVAHETCVGTTCFDNATGKYLNAAPKFSGVLAGDYTYNIGEHDLVTHVDYTWRSRAYFDPSNVLVMSQAGYGLLNADAEFFGANRLWSVQVWGKNLNNAKYYVVTAGSGVVPDGVVGDPLTFGAKLTRKW